MNDVLKSTRILPIGTRIRFNQTLTEPACGDHPELLYAGKGELGEICDYGAIEGYWVKSIGHPFWFGAAADEFDVVDTLGIEQAHGISEQERTKG